MTMSAGGSSSSWAQLPSRLSIKEANGHLEELHKKYEQVVRELEMERKCSRQLDDELTRLRQTNRQLEKTRDDLEILVARLDEEAGEVERKRRRQMERIGNELRKLADSIIVVDDSTSDGDDDKSPDDNHDTTIGAVCSTVRQT